MKPPKKMAKITKSEWDKIAADMKALDVQEEHRGAEEQKHAPVVKSIAGQLRREPQAWRKRSGLYTALVGLIVLLIAKFKPLLAMLKFLKLGAILKTGLSMIICIWAYALLWDFAFAAGFVLLIFVHEMGHAVALRYFGIRTSVPVFLPFVGAIIGMKEMPKNARIEAFAGIAGPLMGTAGAVFCWAVAHYTSNPFWMALAYTGFFLNLFNLIPISPLDGGRTVAAISPKLWIVGFIGLLLLYINPLNPLLLIILLLSGQKVFAVWKKTEVVDEGYYDVGMKTKVMTSILYFGLILFLAFGMSMTHYEAEVGWPSFGADSYFNRGVDNYNKGLYDQAIADYNKAIEIDPDDAEAYKNRGAAWMKKGDPDRAISDHTKALEIDPKLAMAYVDRGDAYSGKGEYDQAISDYNEALEIDPKLAWAYVRRGLAYADMGEYEKARNDVIKAQNLGSQFSPKVLKALQSLTENLKALQSLTEKLKVLQSVTEAVKDLREASGRQE